MILFGDRVVCSTSDLVSAARCEFALLRALDAELGQVPRIADPAAADPARDPAVADRLADLRDRFGASVVRVRGPLDAPDRTATPADLTAAHEQTRAALHDRADVVADAVLFDGSFVTRCDFLLRDTASGDPGYIPAAVATAATRMTALLRLSATAEALRDIGFRPRPHAHLWVDGVPVTAPLAEMALVHAARRRRLDLILDIKLGELLPVQWGDRRFLACGRCAVCTTELHAQRDLWLVAGMRATTHAQLRDAGITTIERLAAADDTVTGVPAPAFTALRRQAELQLHRERSAHPTHTLLSAAALAALPPPTPGDLFLTVAPALGVAESHTRAAEYHLAPSSGPGIPGSDPFAPSDKRFDPHRAGPGRAAPRWNTAHGPVMDGFGDPIASPPIHTAVEHGVLGRSPEIRFAPGDLIVRVCTVAVPGYLGAAVEPPGNLAAHSARARADYAAQWGAGNRVFELLAGGGTGGAGGTFEAGAPHPGAGALATAAWHPVMFAPGHAPVSVRSFVIRRSVTDPEDDGLALLAFLEECQARHPDLRIHHYRTALRPLLSELGERRTDGEDAAAELLPAVVDLYPIVRAAMIVGARSYDLSELPPNRAAHDHIRSGDPYFTHPGDAGRGRPGDPAANAGMAHGPDESHELQEDPEAVLRLRDWLAELAAEHGVPPARRLSYDYWESGPDEVEAALREFADSGHPDHRDIAQVAAAYTAAALGYHRRERRPLRWAHEDRLDHPVEEWAETPGVLIADQGTVDTDWHGTGHQPLRRYLTLTGRLGTGNAPPPGTPVLTLYDRPAPGMRTAPGRRAFAYATVLGGVPAANFEDVIRVVELLPEDCAPYTELPSAIVPRPPGRDEHLEDVLEDVAHQLLVALPDVPANAVFDLLCRRPPRLRGGGPLPEVFGDHASAVTAAILELDNSYVAVQGPPGTGKTDTVARVLERLVTRYRWRVGVMARAHPVVEHVLDAVVREGILPELVGKTDARSVASEWLHIEAAHYTRFLDNAVNGCVVGGLTRDFTEPGRIPCDRLDLLVIVDAGRLPLAEAVAVAAGAANLLLVGDLAPAAGHGVHPEPVGDSVLGRVVGPHRTLPAAYGYFLDRTWRMHPRMSGPVSRLRYDNRLRSNETVTLARELDGVAPGVRTVTVEHHGNSTESAEEAREIVRQVRTLLGLPWQTAAGTRRLHPHDILVVAPYHAQVARIRTLLSRARIEDVLVGTADHFQGREAAVVLVSMTTSAPGDAPRGVGALVSRHWVTGAISRAMWSAIIVRSPLLTEFLPATEAELSDLAAVLQVDRL
ncbi:AAA domain-containing protein [Nocardia sp. NPDC055321]